MVRTNSTMLPLGTTLPEFDLEVVSGINPNGDLGSSEIKRMTKQSLSGKPVLVMVICAHCPFVKHIEQGLTAIDKDYGDDVQILGVSSNSLITHPQDAPDYLASQAKRQGWRFPYLFDRHQNFAKALKASCTPDFFLFSSRTEKLHKLQYRGQLDASRPGNTVEVTGSDLRAALDSVLNGEEILFDQKPSIGCNIKWHPGEEPSWFC